MKHKINVLTGLCSQCGLSANQKLTTDCIGRQLRSDIIKLVVNKEIDVVDGNWIDLKRKSQQSDINSPILIKSIAELPVDVQQALHELLDELDLVCVESPVQEPAKQHEIPKEDPDFSFEELQLLQQIKDDPMHIHYVVNFHLSISNMARLRTLIKYGAVTVVDDHYQVSLHGESFLTKPEVFITATELAFMLYCQRSEYSPTEVLSHGESCLTFKELHKKGLVKPVLKSVVLTDAGHEHIAKLCAIPL